MADVTLYANNDWDPTIVVTWLSTDKQNTRPYETGDGVTPTCFLADSDDTDVTAVSPHSDPSLVCTVTYLAVGGLWLVHLDASVLTKTLLGTLAGTGKLLYLHVRTPNGSRQAIPVPYVANRPGLVV